MCAAADPSQGPRQADGVHELGALQGREGTREPGFSLKTNAHVAQNAYAYGFLTKGRLFGRYRQILGSQRVKLKL